MDTSADDKSSTRDPHALNAHVVRTEWEYVFAEADGLHMPKLIWRVFNLIYDYTLRYFYMFLAIVLGVFVSFLMAIVFAIVGFFHVWLITPILRLLRITCFPVRSLVEMMTQACVVPCVQAYSLLCSRIHTRYQRVPDGEPPEYSDYFQV